MVLLQAGSFACMWGIQHLAVRAQRWGPVITSQLASNAFGRIVPGGVAASGALQYSMLVRAGVPAAAAASGMTASSLLLFGTLLALPLLALPAVLGGVAVDPHLTRAALAGAALFVLMVALGAACVVWDRPLIARRPRRAGDPQPACARTGEPLAGLPERLLRERDIVVRVLGKEWWKALLLAVGPLAAGLPDAGGGRVRGRRQRPHVSLVLLAFCAAQLLGTMPLTPGGLGLRGGRTNRNARAGGGGRRRRRGGDARLPPRLVLAADPRSAGSPRLCTGAATAPSEVEPPPLTPTPEPDAASPGPPAARSAPTSR